MQGFSLRILKYMVHFAKEYPDFRQLGNRLLPNFLGVITFFSFKNLTPSKIDRDNHLESLPAELKGSLPSIEEIDQELEEKEL